jgi:hypothetical protein
MPDVYFPEPDVRDDTWGKEEGQPVEWLQRSTLPRAKSIRAALNENLNQFEPKHAASLAKKLRADWKSHFFELLVGRCLQEMGARVEHEPPGTTSKRIDFRATFADAAVSVEAVSKRMNLHAVAGRAYVDNSEQRIRLAYRDADKRLQAEGATAKPAFLAIDGGNLGARLKQFDLALLGSDVQHMGFDREIVGLSFRTTTGEMLRDIDGPWAGVLAFIEPGVFGAREPVLYVSPHFEGHLPFAFLRLRRRMLATQDFPATGEPVIDRIRFGEPHSAE